MTMTKGFQTMTKRLQPDDRRRHILEAAVDYATRHGYNKLTRDGVASQAKCSTGLVSRYYATMPQLRRAVMRAAIRDKNIAIIAQGIGAGDTHARKAPADLKKQALKLLGG